METLDVDARLSVVMLTHNALETTRTCLGSILAILPEPMFEELLILDNASSDGTREYILSLAGIDKVRVICSDQNLGVARGRDRLFALARGPLIASLDSDVMLKGSGFLRAARALLVGDPDIGICGASGYRVHFSGGQLHLKPYTKEGAVDCVSGFCQIFPRQLLERIRIDTRFSPFWCEDTDFCFQARAQGFGIHRLEPEPGLHHCYRSIDARRDDPRKAHHEAMLVRKWSGRVALLGDAPWPRLQRRLRRIRRVVVRLPERIGRRLRRRIE
ncbi:MAG: glycosyltransferase [Halieaceae bacterium]|jgi:GT2 family glycosyltransferase|nr:glycosyltransferase [Halieaceae bacterium]